MKKTLLLTLLLALNACATIEGSYETVVVRKELTENTSDLKVVKSFAFGSCNKQYLPQPLWKNIVSDKPDLFLWTGDVVYADTEDMGKLSQIYASQLAQAEYSRFLAAKIPVLGIWDDHDYGVNAGDSTFPEKTRSQELFLDFIGEESDSPRRKQEGIQAVYNFGSGKSAVRFILLDTHAHRTRADLLGDQQWTWVEGELKKESEGVTVLVSSIQVLNIEQKFEKWQNFPSSYKRLTAAIASSPSKNIIIVSGDRHFAELSKARIGEKDIWEVTSSGMTHAFRNPDEARNRNSLRVGPLLDRLNYGLITFNEASIQIQVKDLNNTAVIDQTLPLH